MIHGSIRTKALKANSSPIALGMRLLVVWCLAVCCSATSPAQTPGRDWLPVFGTGPNDDILGLVLFDIDGDGPFGEVPVVACDNSPFLLARFGNQWKVVESLSPSGPRFVSYSGLTTFDPDGSGPQPKQLLAIGMFNSPEDFRLIGQVVRWNAGAWIDLGLEITNADTEFTSIDPDDEGPSPPRLLIAGYLAISGGSERRSLAQWDGSTWSPLGIVISPSEIITEVCSFDSDGAGPQPSKLIAAGYYRDSTGVLAGFVAARTDATWTLLSGAPSSAVSAMISFDADGSGPLNPQLYVAPTRSLEPHDNRVTLLRWDGNTWTPFESEPSFTRVRQFVSLDPDGNGPMNPQLIAEGVRLQGFNAIPNPFSRWDGSNWASLGSVEKTTSSDFVIKTTNIDGLTQETLLASGNFALPDRLLPSRLIEWDGTAWHPLTDDVPVSIVDMTVHDFDGPGALDPQLVISLGATIRLFDDDAPFVLRWDGANWIPLGDSRASRTSGLISWDPDQSGPALPELIAAGEFASEGAYYLEFLRRWDGTQWTSFAPGLRSQPRAWTTFDFDGSGPQATQLVVSGSFQFPGENTPVSGLARWDGDAWIRLPGQNDFVYTLTAHDADGVGPVPAALYADRQSLLPDGTLTLSQMFRLDTEQWEPLGEPRPLGWGYIDSTSFDPDGPGPELPQLIATSFPFNDFSRPRNARVDRWTGLNWVALRGAINGRVNSLTPHDPDGFGPLPPELIVTGNFTRVDGRSIESAARWDGSDWSSLGSGIDGEVSQSISLDPDGLAPQPAMLVMRGSFNRAGPFGLASLAAFGNVNPLQEPRCGRADIGSTGGVVSPDTILDNNDFVVFTNLFFDHDPRADLGIEGGANGADGNFDNNDCVAFIRAFFAGSLDPGCSPAP